MDYREMWHWLEMFAGLVKGVFLFWTNVMYYLTLVIKIVCALPGILVRSVIEAIPYGLACGAVILVGQLAVFGWRKLAEYRAQTQLQESAEDDASAIDPVTVPVS